MGTTSWEDLLHPGKATDFFARRPFSPFDPATSEYRPTNALWLAELCRLVYRHDVEEDTPPPQPTRTSFLEMAGFRQRKFFLAPATDTQAMLVEFVGGSPFAVLVFRGTERALKDVVTDLEIGKLRLGGVSKDIHEGFLEAFNSVWGDIASELAQLPATCPLFYAGHSLGAALATLAAASRAPQALYTFGSPRVGNQVFVESLAQFPIHRVVDDRDLVPTLPPEIMKFQHAGVERQLRAPSKGQSLPHHPFRPPKFLADHAPINYVDRL